MTERLMTERLIPLLRLFPFSHLQQLYYCLLNADVDNLIVTVLTIIQSLTMITILLYSHNLFINIFIYPFLCHFTIF